MQCKGTLVRTILLRPFPIHANARHARRFIEAVALIGPHAVDTKIVQRFVIRPVTWHGAIGGPAIISRASTRHGFVWRALIGDGAAHALPFDDDVQHDLEM